MTVSNQVATQTFPGNGVQTLFAFTFDIPSNSDGSAAVLVETIDSGGNVVVIPSNQFSITGLDNPSGGFVTYPLSGSPIPTGTKLVIQRALPYIQQTAVANQSFYPHTVEQMADYLTLCIQQLNDRVNAGGTPGGNPDWNALINKPGIITGQQSLTPATGQIIEFLGPNSAHMIPTPSGGGGGGNVTSSLFGLGTATRTLGLTIGDYANVNDYLNTGDTNYDGAIGRALAAKGKAYFPKDPALGGTTYNTTGTITLAWGNACWAMGQTCLRSPVARLRCRWLPSPPASTPSPSPTLPLPTP